MSWTFVGTFLPISTRNIIHKSLKIKNTLNINIKYFQFLCLKEGCCDCSLLFFVIKSKTMTTKDIWNTLTVRRENQNKTSNTKTNELLSQIDLRTRVILIAHLKFLFTIRIRHILKAIYIFKDAVFSKKVIKQMEKNMM